MESNLIVNTVSNADGAKYNMAKNTYPNSIRRQKKREKVRTTGDIDAANNALCAMDKNK